jgi:diguanylate cyclase (GGDEF)-like protein
MRHLSVRKSLLLLVIVCVIPTVTLCSYLAFNNFRLFKSELDTETRRLAESLMNGIDQELTGIDSGLKVLATSDSLVKGDLKAFHAQAKAAVRSQIIYNYVLTDSEGKQQVNTLVPFGQALPTSGTPPALRRVFTDRISVLTDYFIGPVTGKPALAMGVPVSNAEGQTIYSLNIGLSPNKLSELLQHHALPPGWVAALIDTSGTIVGRTPEEQRFVGQKAVPDLVAEISQHRNGKLETTTKDGRPVLTAYASSDRWRWAVAVGAPKELLEAQLRQTMLTVGLTSAFILCLASWIGISIFRRLSQSISALSATATAINRGDPVTPPEVELTEAQEIATALARASTLISEMHHMAYHDPLTDLGNRTFFYELLDNSMARAQREGHSFSLLMLDLDKFKEVNDQEGHPAGDGVLQTVAQRIKAEVRAGDLAARLGGDEFGILLHNADRVSAQDVAERLRESLSAAYPKTQISITASIGIVTWQADITSSAAMIDLADRALYMAKSQGRNAVRSVSPDHPIDAAPADASKLRR